jgi:hypothetical protein
MWSDFLHEFGVSHDTGSHAGDAGAAPAKEARLTKAMEMLSHLRMCILASVFGSYFVVNFVLLKLNFAEIGSELRAMSRFARNVKKS